MNEIPQASCNCVYCVQSRPYHRSVLRRLLLLGLLTRQNTLTAETCVFSPLQALTFRKESKSELRLQKRRRKIRTGHGRGTVWRKAQKDHTEALSGTCTRSVQR